MKARLKEFGMCLALGLALFTVGCDLRDAFTCGLTLEDASTEDLLGELEDRAVDAVTGLFDDD